MNKVKLALVGRGKWGQNYIKTIRESNLGCELPESNIKTRDFKDFFDQKDLIGVIVASPTSTHFHIAYELLQNGHNLLIEKPMTETLEQALALQLLKQKQKELTVMVGHIQLFDPGYIALKKNLNLVGDIEGLEYYGLQSPIREDVTVLEDWGPHPTYLFLDLAGKKTTSVNKRNSKDDNIELEFKLSNIKAIAYLGWTNQQRVRKLIVSGTKGSLVLDSSENKQLYFSDKDNKLTDLEFDNSKSALAIQIAEFIDAVKSKRAPQTDIGQGVEVVRIIEKAKTIF